MIGKGAGRRRQDQPAGPDDLLAGGDRAPVPDVLEHVGDQHAAEPLFLHLIAHYWVKYVAGYVHAGHILQVGMDNLDTVLAQRSEQPLLDVRLAGLAKMGVGGPEVEHRGHAVLVAQDFEKPRRFAFEHGINNDQRHAQVKRGRFIRGPGNAGAAPWKRSRA